MCFTALINLKFRVLPETVFFFARKSMICKDNPPRCLFVGEDILGMMWKVWPSNCCESLTTFQFKKQEPINQVECSSITRTAIISQDLCGRRSIFILRPSFAFTLPHWTPWAIHRPFHPRKAWSAHFLRTADKSSVQMPALKKGLKVSPTCSVAGSFCIRKKKSSPCRQVFLLWLTLKC